MSSIGAFRILEVHLNKPGKAPGGTGRWQAHPQSQRKASWYIGKAVAVSTWFADLEQSVLGINWEAIKGRAEHSQIMQIHRLCVFYVGGLTRELNFRFLLRICEYRQMSQTEDTMIFH